MCRDCYVDSSYKKDLRAEKLYIEMVYDIVIKDNQGEIKKLLRSGSKWDECEKFFNDLKRGFIDMSEYTKDLADKCEYTVEVVVCEDKYAFH